MIDSKDYKISKLLCLFANEILYVGLYKCKLFENEQVIYILIYSENNKPPVVIKYELLEIAFEDFKKKVNI